MGALQPLREVPWPPEGTQFDKGWQNALVAFGSAEFKPGDIIPMAWFFEHFRVKDPASRQTIGEFQEQQFKFMGEMDRFQKALAEDYDLVLQNVRGEGYRIVPPHEQTDFAMDRVQREFSKAISRAHMRLTHVRLAELSDDQRRQNADAQAKLAAFRSQGRKALA
ncbi:hypothetical protein [Solidesulfovibrio sp.]